MAPRRPRAVFFDLDGTLIDREPLMGRAVIEVGRRVGLPVGRDQMGALVGQAWQDVFRGLGVAERLGWDLERFLAEVLAEGERLLEAGHPAPVLPGAVELIEVVHGLGVPLALVTGSVRAEADSALELLGVRDRFAVVLAAEDYDPGKPSPACYLAAAAALDIAVEAEAGACVVVEDSTVGVAAGRAAGMRVVASEAANAPPGHPAHQDLDEAHLVVDHLGLVDEAVLATLVEPPAGRTVASART